jgi:hypothetical protein
MTKLEKQIQKVKREMQNLFEEYKREALLEEIALENNNIPQQYSKAQFKKIVSVKKNFTKRNTLDRLFLEHLEILPTIKKNKDKSKKKSGSAISSVAKMAQKIRNLQNLSEQEADIIQTLIKDLNNL